MIAVIQTGGKQYTVQENDKIRIEKLPAASRKDGKAIFESVLLISSEAGDITIGKPTVANARVEASIVKDDREDKIRVIKYKAKTRYKRTRGHRQPFTEIKIEKISVK